MIECENRGMDGRCMTGCAAIKLPMDHLCPYFNKKEDEHHCMGHSHALMLFLAKRTRQIYEEMRDSD